MAENKLAVQVPGTICIPQGTGKVCNPILANNASGNNWVRYDTGFLQVSTTTTQAEVSATSGSGLELFKSGLGDAASGLSSLTKTLAHTNMGQGGHFGCRVRVHGFAFKVGQLGNYSVSPAIFDKSDVDNSAPLIRHILENAYFTYQIAAEAQPEFRGGLLGDYPFFAGAEVEGAPRARSSGIPLAYVPLVSPFDPPIGGTPGQNMVVRVKLDVGAKVSATFSGNATLYVPITAYLIVTPLDCEECLR